MLTRAEIKGFKCLHDVSVELGPFNVLIGPNDSGKSSFLQALGEPQRLVWSGSECSTWAPVIVLFASRLRVATSTSVLKAARFTCASRDGVLRGTRSGTRPDRT